MPERAQPDLFRPLCWWRPLVDDTSPPTPAKACGSSSLHMTARQIGGFRHPERQPRSRAPGLCHSERAPYHSLGTLRHQSLTPTAASYFLALPLVTNGPHHSEPSRPGGPGELQGDTQFIEVLEKVGIIQTYLPRATPKVQIEPGTPAARASKPTPARCRRLARPGQAWRLSSTARPRSPGSPTPASRRPTASAPWPGS